LSNFKFQISQFQFSVFALACGHHDWAGWTKGSVCNFMNFCSIVMPQCPLVTD
jgi:hypothetical protein